MAISLPNRALAALALGVLPAAGAAAETPGEIRARYEAEARAADPAWAARPAGEPRITTRPRFRHEHGKEIPAWTFADSRVERAANCGACHRDAARGDHSERGIALPAH